MVNNCYELCLEFIHKCSDLDFTMEKYSKSTGNKKLLLEKEIDRIEFEIFELKDKMKKINI